MSTEAGFYVGPTTVSRELVFTVIGQAATKGSTRAFVITPKGRGRPRVVTTGDNPRTKGWQATIANCAALELVRPQNRGCRFEAGAVTLEVAFFLPRPKALLTAKAAPVFFAHVKKPDLDKLLRAVKDALTGVVWTDDSQVTQVLARKTYCGAGEFPRAEIRVRPGVGAVQG